MWYFARMLWVMEYPSSGSTPTQLRLSEFTANNYLTIFNILIIIQPKNVLFQHLAWQNWLLVEN